LAPIREVVVRQKERKFKNQIPRTKKIKILKSKPISESVFKFKIGAYLVLDVWFLELNFLYLLSQNFQRGSPHYSTTIDQSNEYGKQANTNKYYKQRQPLQCKFRFKNKLRQHPAYS
jgi:hypothetical protein